MHQASDRTADMMMNNVNRQCPLQATGKSRYAFPDELKQLHDTPSTASTVVVA
jgi:hypothetical protein